MTLLAEYRNRRAAHGRHVCGLCRRPIAAGERYIDQRVAYDGRACTFRSHHACDSAYWTWIDAWDDEGYALVDLTGGHLPPCPRAWADQIGPCLCVGGRER